MSRRIHRLLVAGCGVIVFLQAPDALQSLREGWNGAYALERPSIAGMQAAVVVQPEQADASVNSELEKSAQTKKNVTPVLRAGF
ncbi:MAG: hypothetical protein ACI8TQ_000077 [Planctomycetota bacterium]|jgi:hypothetical protein